MKNISETIFPPAAVDPIGSSISTKPHLLSWTTIALHHHRRMYHQLQLNFPGWCVVHSKISQSLIRLVSGRFKIGARPFWGSQAPGPTSNCLVILRTRLHKVAVLAPPQKVERQRKSFGCCGFYIQKNYIEIQEASSKRCIISNFWWIIINVLPKNNEETSQKTHGILCVFGVILWTMTPAN